MDGEVEVGVLGGGAHGCGGYLGGGTVMAGLEEDTGPAGEGDVVFLGGIGGGGRGVGICINTAVIMIIVVIVGIIIVILEREVTVRFPEC